MKKTDTVQYILDILDTAEPKIDYSDRVEDTYDIKHAMADAYANPGFRKFLMANYNGAVKAAVLGTKDNFDFNRARAITYKEIFSRCRQSFENFERIRKKGDLEGRFKEAHGGEQGEPTEVTNNNDQT